MESNWYVRFRGSKFFLFGLAAFIGMWLFCNLILPLRFHFDDSGFGRLNLLLSVEASLSVALLLQDNAKAEAVQRQQLMYILHMMESLVELLQKTGPSGHDES